MDAAAVIKTPPMIIAIVNASLKKYAAHIGANGTSNKPRSEAVAGETRATPIK